MNVESYSQELKEFEDFLKRSLNSAVTKPNVALADFWEGMNYSLFGGGKRFRPLLSILTAKALKKSADTVFPVAASIEMIHTYSLIHDDLPCLDNDDFRRGRPTHHKKFGEDMALLAGDGLLTLAFYTLATNYFRHPKCADLVAGVSAAAGIQGMVGGQVLDMKWEDLNQSEDILKQIHELKTGALIEIAVRGAALACEARPEQVQTLSNFGKAVGLAFQIADDIQDAKEGEESKNFVALWGEEKTLSLLSEVSSQALDALKSFGPEADPLRSLVTYNLERKN